jgi:catechol-2,3-dioxygenase
MKSPWIEGLRSVSFDVPDLGKAERFYTAVWHLEVATRTRDTLWLRGSGRDHHLLALHAAEGPPQLRSIVLRALDSVALQAIAQASMAAGGRIERGIGVAADPAGGLSIVISDADGRRFEIVHCDEQRSSDDPPLPDQPVRLAHAVLNCRDLLRAQHFLERAFGFVLADRTRIMAFMNCNDDHHSLALGDSDNDALNHVAFLMPSLDAVMRGGGRMKDSGFPAQWGPGRHGPGDNAFNYFVDPFGIVIEYTAEVEQIDDSYRPGGPSDWIWPAGRIDQWGIGTGPTELLKKAQRSIHFSGSTGL